jgi:hypothetical protein
MLTERSSKTPTPRCLVSAAGGAIGVLWTAAKRQAMALIPQDLTPCDGRLTPALLHHLLDESGPGEGTSPEAAAPLLPRPRDGSGLMAALLRDTGA